MRKLYILLILLFLTPLFCYATIYKWSDKKGVHYSDQHSFDAQPVNLTPEQISAINPARQVERLKNIESTQIPENYQSLMIIKPQPEETIHYDNGKVCIEIAVIPQIHLPDKLALFLDGKLMQDMQQKTVACIYNIERGEHHLQVKVLTADEKILLSSPPVTFYMHQPSALK